jgi:phosphatidylinositol alpha-1,6-mannosyltransferase
VSLSRLHSSSDVAGRHVVALLTDLCGPPGGIQTFNRNLVKALEEIAACRGWKVTLLVLNDSASAGVVENLIDVGRTRYLSYRRSKWRFAAMALRAGTRRSTVVFGHLNFVSLAGILRLLSPRSEMLLIVHGIDVERPLSPLERLSVRRINQILSVSAFTRDRMISRHSLGDARFAIVPGLPAPRYGAGALPQSRSDLALPPGRMILSVSRLDSSDRYKNIDLVIESMSAVLREVPDAFYVVVGDGTDRARLMGVAKGMGVDDRVHFAGRVSDELLAAFYQTCDVFVLPSTREGFGIVFLEAMYYAKPCIGVRAGAIHEVIDEGKTGLLTEPGDPRALAQALVTLLTCDTVRSAMGRAGRRRFESEFSFPRFLERLKGVLSSDE